ncbi:type II secretion system protein GspG [Desulfosporosinus sp. BG]|uniref:type II secretion system protein GspG n=1 Tax=Desulfosporosinus sp. BG TaxID=1633135 RepID=UPI000858ED6A|nr:type II secretion system protein GspG [Desulfosporosinus sp. BG]ODA41730.1 putative secretion system X protein GspG-like 3 [Desulfosporosinus sp. BG]
MLIERNLQSGFTLWELLLVLFLMGVLLTSVIPHFGSASNQVLVQVDLANIQKIEGAAQLYRIDVGAYPPSVQDLAQAPRGVSRWRGPYLSEIPIDPFDSTEGYQIDAFGQVK